MKLGTGPPVRQKAQWTKWLATGDWSLAGANRRHEWVRNNLADPMEVTSPAVAAQIAGEPEKTTATHSAKSKNNKKSSALFKVAGAIAPRDY